MPSGPSTRRRGSATVLLTLLVVAVRPPSATAAEVPLFPPLEPDATPRAQLVRALSRLGHELLSRRRTAVSRIETPAQLEERRRAVREGLLRLMGGVPIEGTPLEARVVARSRRQGFTVENVVFQSLPGFGVTANVYRPDGPGPFPALLASMGHGDAGKAGERLGPDLVRKGFVVLQYDPLGQGERLQHYDPVLRASRAGSSTEEHGQAAARSELIGESVLRYFVRDAMRGLDYLEAREDVDRDRLGAVGCSGGGTVTTALAALDPRVKAAAVGCYVTSWDALLEGPGPQEAEQSLFGFLAEGLDMADWVALVAPRPLLIASTTEDFFPLDGARSVYEEARRYYALDDAPERITWAVGPGPHGFQREGREAVAAFFLRWLRGGEGDAADEADARLDPEELACTEGGQISTSPFSRTVADLVAARAAEVLAARKAASAARPPADEQARIRGAIAEVAGVAVRPGGTPVPVRVHRSEDRPSYRLEVVSLAVEDGVDLWGLLAVPGGGPGPHPAALLVDPRLRGAGAAPGSELDQLARDGRIVLAIEPRGTLVASEMPARVTPLGPYAALFRRASVDGRCLVGLRAEDVLRATDVVCARDDVDPGRVDAFGYGAGAVPLLHAAVLDERIARLALEDAPVSYRAVLDHPIHRGLPEILVPGVLRHYDLDELMHALAPRPVTLVNPVDAVGQPLGRSERERYLGFRDLEAPGQVRVIHRRRGEPLRW